ncbi:glycoside hydrolase family 28 protein [Alteromonas sp. NFXS44]|uniref:glycoside hydrolase family 28 protein n=1 Tax=Alteromonas sp. NFXS44 TaxID=2818435 RepID=UPI0032DEB166
MLPRANAASSADPWQRANEIKARVGGVKPLENSFNIESFGAKSGGDFDNSLVFKKVIQACHDAGGGRVIVPPGDYLTGAIELLSNVTLQLLKGAILRFSTQATDYPIVLTRYEGVELYNFSPLIYAKEAKNIAVKGEGILDGQASNDNWWSWCGSPKFGWEEGMPQQHQDRMALFKLAEENVPVSNRIFGRGHYLRPSFIEFYRCENVEISGIELKDAPFWNIHPVLSENILIKNVTVRGKGPNNDGCNPESCKDVVIENCFFDTGDDCIAIKSGRNADGRRINVPSQNILVEKCTMRDGHGGLVVGSEISGGVNHVYIQDCEMSSPELWYALRFKSNAMRGGDIHSIFARRIKVGQVKYSVVMCNFQYEEAENGSYPPTLHKLNFTNLEVLKAHRIIEARGLPNALIGTVSITRSKFYGVTEENITEHVSNLVLEANEIFTDSKL